jgi:hypothetical protein
MSAMTKFEDTIGGLLKPIPHLPTAGQKWIAENVWWIILVGVILSGISVLVSIGGIFTALAFLGAATSYFGYYGVQSYTGWWVLASVISLLFMIAVVVVSAISISPLKAMKEKGWSLLFLTLLISAVEIVVSVLVNFTVVGFIFGIIFGAIGLAISAYFLYEIRSYFKSAVVAK